LQLGKAFLVCLTLFRPRRFCLGFAPFVTALLALCLVALEAPLDALVDSGVALGFLVRLRRVIFVGRGIVCHELVKRLGKRLTNFFFLRNSLQRVVRCALFRHRLRVDRGFLKHGNPP